jgi:hypothetical protein
MDYYLAKPDYNNDFNYPSLNRKDLMSLDTIKEKDFKKRGINRLLSNRDWSMGSYNRDIDKSFPKRRDLYLNKIDFINKIDDIEKARPNKERIFNKPNFSLNVRDIEKAYPKKERQFHGKIYNENKSEINEIYKPKNENNRYIKLISNNYEKNYNIDENNNNGIFKRNIFNLSNYIDTVNIKNKINRRKNNSLKIKSHNTKSLDTLGVLQSQKNYKDTIHDIFNHYPEYNNNIPQEKDFYYLNHNPDLFLGIPNKDNRLDIIMDKSNKYLYNNSSEKLSYLDKNKINFKNLMIKPNSVKISKQIPSEFKNQGLESLYKELESYKPRTYEQNMDLFTQNY